MIKTAVFEDHAMTCPNCSLAEKVVRDHQEISRTLLEKNKALTIEARMLKNRLSVIMRKLRALIKDTSEMIEPMFSEAEVVDLFDPRLK